LWLLGGGMMSSSSVAWMSLIMRLFSGFPGMNA